MDIILKILKMIFDLTTNKSQDLSDQVLIKIRKLILLVITALGSMTLVCFGITIIAMDLVEQSNKYQSFTFSGPIQIGATLAITMLGMFFYCLSQKTWLAKTQTEQNNNFNKRSPIEEAIGLLIKDIVIERQEKRKHE